MKKVVFLVAALFFCTSSVFAWNAESFTNGSVYEYEPVMAASTFSLDDGVAVAALSDSDSDSLKTYSGQDFYNIFSFGNCKTIEGNSPEWSVLVSGTNQLSVLGESYTVPGVTEQSVSMTGYLYSDHVVYSSAANKITVSSSLDYPEIIAAPSFLLYSTDRNILCWSVSDIPSGSRFFSMSGALGIQSFFKSSSSSYCMYTNGFTFGVYINGQLVHTFNSSQGNHNIVDFGDFVYSSSRDITSIEFRIPLNRAEANYDTYSRSGFYCGLQLGDESGYDKPQFSVGNLDNVLSPFNDHAQDSINEHESVESQWTGSMTENFNSLDLEDFTFPNGLISAFALITGIFNDLWNALGEYKILFVFPLCLGIVLLLIGRISKFDFSDRSGGSGGSGPPAVI